MLCGPPWEPTTAPAPLSRASVLNLDAHPNARARRGGAAAKSDAGGKDDNVSLRKALAVKRDKSKGFGGSASAAAQATTPKEF